MSEKGISRYSPQHPLPEELRIMKRDETVCKYCGVSYLIHNEIKMLEDRLKKTEADLKSYKGSLEREAALKEDVARYAATLETYQKTLQDRDNIIGTVTTEIEGKNNQIQDLRRTKQALENQLMEEINKNDISRSNTEKYQSLLPTINSTVKFFKSELLQLRSDMQKGLLTSKTYFNELAEQQPGAFVTIVAAHDKLISENASLCAEIEKFKLLRTKLDVEARKLCETEEQLNEMIQTNEKVTETNKRNRKEISELTECLENEKAGKRMADALAQQYKEQLNAKAKELEMIVANKLNNEKSMETSVLVLQDKLKNKEHEYQQVIIECERLRCETNQRQEQQNHLEAEIRRRVAASRNEVSDLMSALMKTEEDLILLKTERENAIRSHQQQIEDLRYSFKQKLKDAENWQEKVNEALRDERWKHNKEVEALEKRLRSEFKTESEIDKQRHQELSEKYRKNLREAEIKFKSEIAELMAAHKSELSDAHRQLTETKKRQHDCEQRQKTEISGLKTCIQELEERLARLGAGNEDRLVELRNSGHEKDSEIFRLKNELSELERRIRELTEQISHLQETVRRECEERFELTEALSIAKEELLALKRPSGGYPSPSPRLTIHNEQRRHSLNSICQSQSSIKRPSPIREAFTANEAVIGGDVSILRTDKQSANQIKGGTVSDGRKRIAAAMGRR